MSKICDFCNQNIASIEDSSINNGIKVNYSFCEDCYKKLLIMNKPISQIMEDKINRIGKECKTCGCKFEDFQNSLLFSCPDCYLYMREVAFKTTMAIQNSINHRGKRI